MTTPMTTPIRPPETVATPMAFSHAASGRSTTHRTPAEHAPPVRFSAPAHRPRH